ncbi:invasin B [Herbaspirillum sp. Sphag1AN]|uniref:type III secretion system translocon subunit SctE n=1 Tax=unclassified Herbaspirillum TaxID=2624150 RepID=UPI00161C65EE|nr:MULTISPECIES: type III secretion system translocon subunit SctE [unclassified Herbaspirillum]MBB3211534.1 invasin B [Herbaspirillum sp. Sphag1AN]MBB3245200.1 invasin B [Herbaspirillum sp. Sphag64]
MNMASNGIWHTQNTFLSDIATVKSAERLTIMPNDRLEKAHLAAKELHNLVLELKSGDRQGRNSDSIDTDPFRPQLTAPKNEVSDAEAANAASYKANILLAEMVETLERGDVNKFASNAHTAMIKKELQNASLVKIASDYKLAVDAMPEDLAELETLAAELSGVIEKITSAESKLAALRLMLKDLDPDSPDFTQLNEACESLGEELKLMSLVRSDLSHKADSVEKKLIGLQKVADELLTRSVLEEVRLDKLDLQKDVSNIARLMALMMKLGELILTTGERRSETQRELLKIQEENRIKQMVIEAKKADDELAKAESLNKAAGCVGKILGASLMAIAAVGAVFTGGASLVLAGVGLALLLADEIYRGVTGDSFMDKLMQPIVAALQPIMQFVIDKLVNVLKEMGVSEQTARMAAMIAVSIAIAVAVVLVMVTGAGSALASAASNVMSKVATVMSKVLEKTIGKLIPEIVKKSVMKTTQQISSSSTKMFDAVSQRLGLSTDPASKQIYAHQLGRVGASLNVARATTEGGLDISMQLANIEVAKAVANMKFSMAELDLISDMFAQLIDMLQASLTTANEFFSETSKAIEQYCGAGTAVARSIRGMRAA